MTRYLVLLSLLCCVFFGCSDDTVSGTSTPSNNSASDLGGMSGSDIGGVVLADGFVVIPDGGGAGSGQDGGVTVTDMSQTNQPDSAFETNEQGQVLCGKEPCACSDGKDNDGDGKIDGFDPECTGAYDNDEGTFATGIPGDNKDPKWQDCFFDGNSGSGDDGCRFRSECFDDPTGKDCKVTDECRNFCQKYTPNGCDCFGCCDVFKPDGTSKSVIIGTDCSLDKIDDESVCKSCTPSTECGNPCGRCELCLGKELNDLPQDCFQPQPNPDMGTGGGADMDGAGGNDMGGAGGSDMGGGGTPYTCEGNLVPCDATGRCAQTEGTYFYCHLGCCYENPG